MLLSLIPLLLLLSQSVSGFVSPLCSSARPTLIGLSLRLQANDPEDDDSTKPSSSSSSLHRRQVLLQGTTRAVVASLFSWIMTTPSVALAGIDPTALKSLPVQGDESGGATRLRQLQAASSEASSSLSDNVDKPWEDLSSGASFREYRQGRGDAGTSVCVNATC